MDGFLKCLFHLALHLSMALKEMYACDAPPSLPYVEVNITTGNVFSPGTVLYFKCNNTRSDHGDVTVTTECVRNNTWVIRGAQHCQPEKCYIAAAIIVTATILAVSATATYILTMFVINALNRKSRYMCHKEKGDVVAPLQTQPLLKQKI